jgi:hypothetical protein
MISNSSHPQSQIPLSSPNNTISSSFYRSIHPSPSPFLLSPRSPRSPQANNSSLKRNIFPSNKRKRLSVEFGVGAGVENLIKNKIFLRVLRDFAENVCFLKETKGNKSAAGILRKISGYMDKIEFLLFKKSESSKNEENIHGRDYQENKFYFSNIVVWEEDLSLDRLIEKIRTSYDLITGEKGEICFDEKFLPVLVYYNRNLEEFIEKINEEMISNGVAEYKERIQKLDNLIYSKTRDEKTEIFVGAPQISVISKIEKIEGELGSLEHIGTRARIKARFLDKLLRNKFV